MSSKIVILSQNYESMLERSVFYISCRRKTLKWSRFKEIREHSVFYSIIGNNNPGGLWKYQITLHFLSVTAYIRINVLQQYCFLQIINLKITVTSSIDNCICKYMTMEKGFCEILLFIKIGFPNNKKALASGNSHSRK